VLTGVPFIDQHGALRAGQLMEVCGVGGSGKTEILMQAAVNCALPVESHGVRFGGCATHVLLLDLDGKFDTLRLLKILTARITDALGRRGGAGNDESNGDETNSINQNNARISDAVYRESVGRFRMIRCHNSLDFLKALAVVGRVFERHETNAGGGYGETVGGMTDGGANGNGNNSETFSKKKKTKNPRGGCFLWTTSPRFTGLTGRAEGSTAPRFRCTQCTTSARRCFLRLVGGAKRLLFVQKPWWCRARSNKGTGTKVTARITDRTTNTSS
jgi:hypothetical protein|tara:strand:- start:2640 stop:3458 length:819 start_codon:yes stop_codon:yes gene_type:complete